MPSVLFICSANRFRSPLAAALLRQALIEEEKNRTFSWNIGRAQDWIVGSAGISGESGRRVLPLALDAAQRVGLDLSTHRSQPVYEPRLAQYDLMLVMEKAHRHALHEEFPHLRERIFLLSHVIEYGSYDILDTHATLEEVLTIHHQLNELIRRSLRYICVLAIALHNQRIRERAAAMDVPRSKAQDQAAAAPVQSPRAERVGAR